MKRISALVGVLLAFGLPSAALGQSSTCQQYNPQLCGSVGPTPGTTPPSPTATTPPSTVPTSTSTKPTPVSTKTPAPTTSTSPGTTTTLVSATAPATTPIPTVTSGSLPFTGLEVVLLAVVAGALLSAGFVIRRLSRWLD